MTKTVFSNGILISLEIDGVNQEITHSIRDKYRPPKFENANEVLPIDWPVWAKALKHFAKPEDVGIGDVVARLIGDTNSAAFKAWHRKTFGKDCNCSDRQSRWNLQYPLK